ncbi:uncharacterized protein [Centruroides vittatus]|uniref:uncharacterized protein n=1 Tax=Centruroides vittatus TaxID=120091 RepID=UPI0035108296
MAAFMTYTRLLRFRLQSIQISSYRNKYVVLLPEIPEDTPETNSLLKDDVLPQYSQLNIEKCVHAVGKFIINYESGICKLEEKLKDGKQEKTFDTVIEPIEKLSVPLEKAWSTLKNIYMTKCDEESNKAYLKLHPRVQSAKFQRFQSLPIYHAMKEVNANREKLTEPQKRVVDKYLLEARLSGIDLTDYNLRHFQTNATKLKENKESYRKKIETATKIFSHTVTDPNIIKDIPEQTLSIMSVDRTSPRRGPWVVTLNPFIYYPFMEYCEDRLERWNVWRAFNSRGSREDKTMSCSLEIEEMRFLRNDQANLLGYETFADMSMETKMANSVQNVLSMIATIHTKSKATTERELNELQEFASKNNFTDKLQVWDIRYWKRRQKEELYGFDEAQVRQYFPLPVVLNGLFKFVGELFDITIQEKTADVDTWHEDVKFYEIIDNSRNSIAFFYLDPYMRIPEKLYGSWMEVGQNRSSIVGTNPFAYLIFNFPRPLPNRPSLLSFQDVQTLFRKFGHLIQHSLTLAPYNEIAGMTNLEWDVVDVCSNFMVHWLYHYDIVASISSHVDDGSPLPQDIHNKLQSDRTHMAGYTLAEQLYKSALDLELYSKRDFWLDISRHVWMCYMPLPFDRDDNHLCSFREIFCDEFPASYFSFLWSEMVAADVFSAFWEVGLDNKKQIKEIGRRFRETFLSVGGGRHSSEVFRQFRGRDPSPGALLKIYKLK